MSQPAAGATGPPTQARRLNDPPSGIEIPFEARSEEARSSLTVMSSRPLITQPSEPSLSFRPRRITVLEKLGSCRAGPASNNPGASSSADIMRKNTTDRPLLLAGGGGSSMTPHGHAIGAVAPPEGPGPLRPW